MRVRYMHSDIDAIERMEILRGLRLGEFDVLVGINLLREGLDLPEVSLVAILDADQEGFLRSDRVADPDRRPRGAARERPRDLLRRPHHRLDAARARRDEPPPRDPARVQRGARHHADRRDEERRRRCASSRASPTRATAATRARKTGRRASASGAWPRPRRTTARPTCRRSIDDARGGDAGGREEPRFRDRRAPARPAVRHSGAQRMRRARARSRTRGRRAHAGAAARGAHRSRAS